MNDRTLVKTKIVQLRALREFHFANLTAACNISIVAVVLALARKGSGVVGASFGRGVCHLGEKD